MRRDDDVRWPALIGAGWQPTQRTLHRYLQIVGKIRMSLVPPHPHWWHTTLYLTDTGLTTGAMPYDGRTVEISFDLVDHRLVVVTGDSMRRMFDLGARPACADFYHDLLDALDDLGLQVDIHPFPYDLGESPSFPEDITHRSYDADAVSAYWRVLAGTEQVLTEFASRFTGHASPVHLFWHLMDLSYTRHSGSRTMEFGMGDERDAPSPAFHYSITPEPGRLVEESLEPVLAHWRKVGQGHRAVLPYDVMRATPDPDQTLLDFYQSAYLAGARSAGWDVQRLDSASVRRGGAVRTVSQEHRHRVVEGFPPRRVVDG